MSKLSDRFIGWMVDPAPWWAFWRPGSGMRGGLLGGLLLSGLLLLLTGCGSTPVAAAAPAPTDIWSFMSGSPWLTFFLGLFAVTAFGQLLALPFRLYNRTLRRWNIRDHGWPPAHCDADGDFRPEVSREQ